MIIRLVLPSSATVNEPVVLTVTKPTLKLTLAFPLLSMVMLMVLTLEPRTEIFRAEISAVHLPTEVSRTSCPTGVVVVVVRVVVVVLFVVVVFMVVEVTVAVVVVVVEESSKIGSESEISEDEDTMSLSETVDEEKSVLAYSTGFSPRSSEIPQNSRAIIITAQRKVINSFKKHPAVFECLCSSASLSEKCLC